MGVLYLLGEKCEAFRLGSELTCPCRMAAQEEEARVRSSLVDDYSGLQ